MVLQDHQKEKKIENKRKVRTPQKWNSQEKIVQQNSKQNSPQWAPISDNSPTAAAKQEVDNV